MSPGPDQSSEDEINPVASQKDKTDCAHEENQIFSVEKRRVSKNTECAETEELDDEQDIRDILGKRTCGWFRGTVAEYSNLRRQSIKSDRSHNNNTIIVRFLTTCYYNRVA